MAFDIISEVEKVYDEYADLLYRIALTHTADSHDAMDAVHDVFVKYATLRKSFKNEEHRKAWLIRSTVNRCHDLFRRAQVRRYTPIEEVDEIAAENDLAPAVREMLESLPDNYKTVLVLHYLEGFSVEECATILGLSVSAVKMRLSRAREMVNEKHKKEDFYV